MEKLTCYETEHFMCLMWPYTVIPVFKTFLHVKEKCCAPCIKECKTCNISKKHIPCSVCPKHLLSSPNRKCFRPLLIYPLKTACKLLLTSIWLQREKGCSPSKAILSNFTEWICLILIQLVTLSRHKSMFTLSSQLKLNKEVKNYWSVLQQLCVFTKESKAMLCKYSDICEDNLTSSHLRNTDYVEKL